MSDSCAALLLLYLDGMNAMFTVEKCPEPVPGPDLRKVKHNNYEEYEGDYDDGESLFNTINYQAWKPQVQARSIGQRTWEHFIAAEEITWDYAPHLKPTDR